MCWLLQPTDRSWRVLWSPCSATVSRVKLQIPNIIFLYTLKCKTYCSNVWHKLKHFYFFGGRGYTAPHFWYRAHWLYVSVVSQYQCVRRVLLLVDSTDIQPCRKFVHGQEILLFIPIKNTLERFYQLFQTKGSLKKYWFVSWVLKRALRRRITDVNPKVCQRNCCCWLLREQEDRRKIISLLQLWFNFQTWVHKLLEEGDSTVQGRQLPKIKL